MRWGWSTAVPRFSDGGSTVTSRSDCTNELIIAPDAQPDTHQVDRNFTPHKLQLLLYAFVLALGNQRQDFSLKLDLLGYDG